MKFNISAGHNPDNKTACGASCKATNMYESTEARYQTKKVIEYLKGDKHTTYNCTCDNGTSQKDVLKKIVAKCNQHSVDLDVSIHFNSGAEDEKGNGRTTGVEVLYTNSAVLPKANLICKNLEAIGFKNRGAKKDDHKYFLNQTNSKAILIEVCFVDDMDDAKIYKSNRDNIARAIADGIEGKKYVKRDNKMDKVIAYSGEVDKIAATILNWKLKDYTLKDANTIKGANVSNLIVVGGGAEKVFPKATVKLVGKDRFDTVRKVLDYIG